MLDFGDGGPRAVDVVRGMRELLSWGGVSESLIDEVAPQARKAARLVVGDSASLLGGVPRLPAEVPWPTAGGVPLARVAQIALADVPAIEERDLLPATGSLVFFYAVHGRFEPTPASDGMPARVIYVPAGIGTMPGIGPQVRVLPEQPIGVVAKMSFPRFPLASPGRTLASSRRIGVPTSGSTSSIARRAALKRNPSCSGTRSPFSTTRAVRSRRGGGARCSRFTTRARRDWPWPTRALCTS
jgi:hypothetical protein